MGYWNIIVPETTTNLITNPSFETGTTDWGTSLNNTIAQSSAASKFGAYSLKCTYQDHLDVCNFSITLTASTIYHFHCWVYVPTGWDGGNVNVVGSGFDSYVLVTNHQFTTGTDSVDTWIYLEAKATLDTDATGWFVVRLSSAPTAGKFIYVDAAVIEQKNSAATTYVDGDQPGCEWTGTAHASTSTRSAQSRAGGRVRDLEDTYSFYVSHMVGAGMSGIRRHITRYALLAGGESGNKKTDVRYFSLIGSFKGSSMANLHALRQALLKVLHPDSHPEDQPVLLRYDAPAVDKEIAVYYESGLEFDVDAQEGSNEDLTIRFVAPDPFFYGIGESGAILDDNDAETYYYIAGRLKSSGRWGALGLTSIPFANGTIYDIAYNPVNNNLYIAGDYTDLDGGEAGGDYISEYNITAGTWAGTSTDPTDVARALAIAPNGDVYAGGDFVNLDDGDGSGDRLAYYDISATQWESVKAGGTASVYALLWARDGTLYIGGDFALWDGQGNQDCITSFDGTDYVALGDGLGEVGTVHALAEDADGNIWIGGATANQLEYWDGSAFNDIAGTSHPVYAVAIDPAINRIYAGGAFTQIGSDTISYLAYSDDVGRSWKAMGTAPNSTVRMITIGPDGMVYVSGEFSAIGGLTSTRTAKWNGASWAYLDTLLPGTPTCEAGVTGPSDPVIPQNYDLYLGFSTTGATTKHGSTTVTNSGTEIAYPRIEIRRTAGTTATCICTIRNETTGKELNFYYLILLGETLTIHTAPTEKRVESSMFGQRDDALLKGSDFGAFALQPGSNQITCFITTGSTIVTKMIWRDTYASLD